MGDTFGFITSNWTFGSVLSKSDDADADDCWDVGVSDVGDVDCCSLMTFRELDDISGICALNVVEDGDIILDGIDGCILELLFRLGNVD